MIRPQRTRRESVYRRSLEDQIPVVEERKKKMKPLETNSPIRTGSRKSGTHLTKVADLGNDKGAKTPSRKKEVKTPKSKKKKKSEDPLNVYDFSDGDEDFDQEGSSPTLCLWSQKRANRKGDFNVYVTQTKPKLMKENPGLSESDVSRMLETRWSNMSDDLKAKYFIRETNGTNGKDTTPVKKTPIKKEEKSPRGRKRKSEPKEKPEKKESSPRKRSSSTPLDKSVTSETPKRPRKSASKENGHVTDKDKGTDKSKEKPPNKRKNMIHQIDVAESEETRTSEDASSLSEVETNENKEINDRVCETCTEEAPDNFIQCTGPCLRVYHKNCLPFNFDNDTTKCQECASDNHLCFICCSHSPDVKKCNDPKCGKFYHVKCIQKSYPHRIIKDGNNEGFICPLHFCLTCYVEHQDDRVHSYMKRRMIKCLKCPTAYHLTDACLAAGSISISHSYIICPEHVIPSKTSKHVNVNWCFSCNTGGSLICCERCPAAFHQQCLKTPLPEGSFYCGDCLGHKQLHYNDIVWVKLGAYRWWPSKVCHPKNVPDNVMNLSHSIGEFPVYFFGSHNYFWIHRGKAFPFVEGDLTKAPALAKGAKRDFSDAITEAIEAFSEWQEARKNSENNRKIKPPPYVYLRCNKRVGKAPKASPKDDDDTPPIVCQCKSDAEDPCGVDEDCFNRLTLIECDPSRCNAGDKCQNRRFRKREYAKVEPFKTDDRGWGLKSQEDIKKGTFVIEYVGELIDEAECENRILNMIENNEPNFYFLTIDRDTIIDAGPKGNLARFMNHSCSPNCETQKWVVGGLTRVGLFAIQDIPKGTELTFNYNLHCRGNEKTACNCGAKNCSGFLGVRPNKLPDEESSKKQAKSEKPKPKPNPKNIAKKEFENFHEDECFKCGEGGDLLMCDKRKCPRSYHLACLKLTKLPRGNWFCPWHHCDDCGRASTKYCDLCPTSFCNEHGSNLLIKSDKGIQICYEHPDQFSNGQPATPEPEVHTNGETNHMEEDIDESYLKSEPADVSDEKSTEADITMEEEMEEAEDVKAQEQPVNELQELSQERESPQESTDLKEAENHKVIKLESLEPEIEPSKVTDEPKKIAEEILYESENAKLLDLNDEQLKPEEDVQEVVSESQKEELRSQNELTETTGENESNAENDKLLNEKVEPSEMLESQETSKTQEKKPLEVQEDKSHEDANGLPETDEEEIIKEQNTVLNLLPSI